MKTRNGFVSNSSSSSFVVVFDKKPENVTELKKMLFEDEDMFGAYGDLYPTERVAQTVWDDMQKQTPNNKDEILITLHGYIINGPNLDDFTKPDNSFDWKAYTTAECKHRQKIFKELIDHNQSAYIYCFMYGDDDGSYFGALEHGGLFKKLKYVHISSH